MLASGSAAEAVTNDWLRKRLTPISRWEPNSNKIRFSTIHAFKGLDAPAVILTDVDNPNIPGFEDLLYVGLSRSTSRLVMLANRRVIAPLLRQKKVEK
jgi:superfamily I DNA/RNA helicase